MTTDLLASLEAAHQASALRGNMSTDAVRRAAAAGVPYTQAIASALLILGGVHGPLEDTQRLLSHEHPDSIAAALLVEGVRVPGWGNSFIKGGEDPDWLPVREGLSELRPDLLAKIDRITGVLHAAGKAIYPNPSAYTAACALAAGIPAAACAYLFIAARLPVWTDLFLKETH